jgi:hypothetical protein
MKHSAPLLHSAALVEVIVQPALYTLTKRFGQLFGQLSGWPVLKRVLFRPWQ